MHGRVFKYFYWDTNMPGVATFSSNVGIEHDFLGIDIINGDILEYTVDSKPVKAWKKHSAPSAVLAEAERQEKERQAERDRELDEWRSKQTR